MSDTENIRRKSLTTTGALALAAACLLIPANMLPVMRIASVGTAPADMTIFSGVKALTEGGLWALGAIVFIASIVVPLIKLIGLSVLLFSVRKGTPKNPAPLAKLYSVLETIGRWSMLDVFVVGFLSGAVRFGALSTIEPRSGIVSFAAVVILTMIATRSFDPSLIEGK